MIHIERVINRIFESNTYVISFDGSRDVWMVDVGDTKKVIDILPCNSVIRGVFLTHTHFDHLYGLNELFDAFPEICVYVSESGVGALYSAKKNLSWYHEAPMEFKGKKVIPLTKGAIIQLYDDTLLESLFVPGHSLDSMAFLVDGYYLFTGDAYIPGERVVSKLPGGDKQLAAQSRDFLMSLSQGKCILPGHGAIVEML